MKSVIRVSLIGISAGLLAGCLGSPSSQTIPGAPIGAYRGVASSRARPNITERVLYTFGRRSGDEPAAGLINVSGTLYGTTSQDGGSGKFGSVFKITPSGTLTVLHRFAGGADGADPQADLIDVNGILYGTTRNGGPQDDGTVFKITPSGTETVLYRFTGRDGQLPLAGLTIVHGVLYGTTATGGAYGAGTVFRVTTAGTENVIHDFRPSSGADGSDPEAPLANVNGVLYGTTLQGGTDMLGTVFRVTTSGREKVIHNFSGGVDGEFPEGITNVGGTLYGITNGQYFDFGTLFKITTSGTETVLYNFAGQPHDGAYPSGRLINIGGTLYGTTLNGGSDNMGTVYKITASGAETLLHSFSDNPDGAQPFARLTLMNHVLYGTTAYGGAQGQGTLFSLTSSR